MRSPADARYFAAWVARVSEAAQAHGGWSSPAEKEGVVALLARARAEFETRAAVRTPR